MTPSGRTSKSTLMTLFFTDGSWRRTAIFAVSAFGCLNAGCSAPPIHNGPAAPAKEQRVICDGSDDLRFALVSPVRTAENFQGVALELGSNYILVSGKCEYAMWLQGEPRYENLGPATIWTPTRVGVLSSETAAELADAFFYEQWGEHAGREYGRDPLSPTPSLVLYDGEARVTCASCKAAPEPLASIAWEATTHASWIRRLHADGQDATGPLRLRVFENETAGTPTDNPESEELWVEWPLDAPPESYATDELLPWEIYGPAHVINDPSQTEALRGLRPSLLDEDHAPPKSAATRSTDGRRFDFAFRDVVPFEDERGRIPELELGLGLDD